MASRGLGGLLVGGFAAVVAVGFTALPDGSNALPDIARHAMAIALPRWGTTEAVSEVVYGSRAFDTFGETFLLLAAVVAVLLLAGPRTAIGVRRRSQRRARRAGEGRPRRRPRPAGVTGACGGRPRAPRRAGARPEHADDDALGAPAPERAVAMTVVVRVGARVAAVILAVAGVYLAAWGYTPGGGFPAGVVLAGCVVLLYTALGHRAVRAAVRPATLRSPKWPAPQPLSGLAWWACG